MQFQREQVKMNESESRDTVWMISEILKPVLQLWVTIVLNTGIGTLVVKIPDFYYA